MSYKNNGYRKTVESVEVTKYYFDYSNSLIIKAINLISDKECLNDCDIKALQVLLDVLEYANYERIKKVNIARN